MAESFQRLFSRAEPQVLSMNVQAALGPVRPPKRGQFSLLVRHFLERFFNPETASPDGDAKTRLVQIAFAASLPPFIVAIYLWPVYHPIAGWPPGQPSTGAPPAYWLQVNHHLFFIVYSFVVMGVATVFEWDLFFPDLLDLFVLGPLPIHSRRAFTARVTAMGILIVGFLVDTNLFSSFVLPMAMDPPDLLRFFAGHILGVGSSGLFAAASILALQGLCICVFGERLFRKVALLLQGSTITLLVIFVLLFPVVSGVVPAMLQSGSLAVRCFPPFWFLGIYQCLIEGAKALPIYATLARTGFCAILLAFLMAVLTYPLAYLRKVRQLVEGPGSHRAVNLLFRPINRVLHTTMIRGPLRRAIFHFISQTLLRVPRYRIYLVLYGGIGLSVVTASILRFTVNHQQIRTEVSADGIRVAGGIVVFWMVAGLRMAFISSGNERGRWIFRIVHGNPPDVHTLTEELSSARTWVLLWTAIVTFGACSIFRAIAPAELLTGQAIAAQILVAASMCLLLTDAFFLTVTSLPFTSEQAREQPNLAMTMLKFFTFFPLVAVLPLQVEPWIESSQLHFALLFVTVAAAHLALQSRQQSIIREYCNQLPLEEDEEDFPMKLGLRY
jgi:hypothetical protein